MALTIGELVGYLSVDNSGWRRGLAQGRKELDGFSRDANGRLRDVRGRFVAEGDASGKGFARGLSGGIGSIFGVVSGVTGVVAALVTNVAGATLRLGVMAGAASLAGSGLSALAGGAATASGSLLLLPAAITAGAAAMVTLKVGMSGFGEAMSSMDDPKKFAESLKKLAPSARETAVAVRGLSPAWREVQRSVQQELFAEMGSVVRQLGGSYLPILREGMTGVASSFGVAAGSAAGFLREAQTMNDTRTIFASTETVVADLANATGPLLSVFRDVAAVGAEMLPGLSAGAGDAAQRFADFISTARQTGQLAEWISNGMSAVGDLARLLGNVGGIIAAVFSAAQGSGVSTLSVLVQATGAARDFLRSAEGMHALSQIFGGIAAAGSGLRPVLFELGQAFTNSIAPAVAEIGPVIGEAVASLARAGGPLGQVLAAVAPLAAFLARVLAEQLAGAIERLAPYVVRLADYLAANPALLTGIATAAGVAAVAFGPLSGVLAGLGSVLGVVGRFVGPLLNLVGGVGGLGRALSFLTGPVGIVLGLLTALYAGNEQFRNAVNSLLGVLGGLVGQIVSALSPALSAIAGVFSTIASAAAPLIEKLAVGLVPIIQKAAEILSLVVTAASPLIELLGNLLAGAIGFVGERLAGLVSSFEPLISIITSVALPILDSLLGTVISVFQNGIVPIIQGAVSVVSGIIETAMALIKGDWSGAWEGIKKIASGALEMLKGAVRGGIDLVVGIFRDLPSVLLGLLRDAGSWLLETGKNIVQGLINGIGAVGGWIKEKIMGFVKGAWEGVKSFFGINSPSRLMMGAGVNIGEGLIIGVDKMSSKFNRAFLDMASPPPIPPAVIPAPRIAAPAGVDFVCNLAPFEARRGAAGGGPVVHVTNHYPQAEPTSTTVNRGLQYAGALGWG
ncbi:hypothetical protein NLX83_10765 [Allokutzneria sp. A3M-2-11 16]|uniref:phage tail protein n=1 Tax=Allokutzneria sp. A3M-2-11 16 TaxID=2962043 RepID=UPI0020B8123E|nr:hypothetical protein [Allokutzneria sp. A3M-2-11 16]MCP3799739.1 hypothetical protein [Allokutzneria sp. A3M-2-11 16]